MSKATTARRKLPMAAIKGAYQAVFQQLGAVWTLARAPLTLLVLGSFVIELLSGYARALGLHALLVAIVGILLLLIPLSWLCVRWQRFLLRQELTSPVLLSSRSVLKSYAYFLKLIVGVPLLALASNWGRGFVGAAAGLMTVYLGYTLPGWLLLLPAKSIESDIIFGAVFRATQGNRKRISLGLITALLPIVGSMVIVAAVARYVPNARVNLGGTGLSLMDVLSPIVGGIAIVIGALVTAGYLAYVFHFLVEAAETAPSHVAVAAAEPDR